MEDEHKSTWIKKNRILIIVVFWGVIAILIWSPWTNIVAITGNDDTSPFSSANCKNIEYISPDEMYKLSQDGGIDMSYDSAKEVALEYNQLPNCDE